MSLVVRAKKFAQKAHKGQLRKPFEANIPYIIHPAAVAKILEDLGIEDPPIIAAAWLHDVVEDCAVDVNDLKDLFGYEVAVMVDMLSNPVAGFKSLSRDEKAKIGREHLAKANYQAQLIKLADILDNSRSISNISPEFAKIWAAEKLLALEVIELGGPFYDKVKQALEQLV